MPYNITVSTGDVADKAAQIQRTAGEIESQLSVLTAQMADLASTWTGPAAAAFQHTYEEWKTTQQQTKTVLDEIGSCLRNTGQVYDEQEDALRSQWS
ncbi:WXG100 family type VII secretion target [Trebonia sp.]|uniref:WXG100 family type VII secretion target n=1 Tax=Trebonia sp. TaxID=2767075 RepID=UPI00261334EA|nr:WXG100 family type VII secretion target [Trebonia sp.]